ncbi:MAG: alpha/beta hydrolase family protein [Candidatus Binatia bacterium]
MRQRASWSSAILATSCAVLLLASCGGGGNGPGEANALRTSAEVLQPGPAGVGVTTVTFEDASRPTMANGRFAGSPTRKLVTEIWYPTDPDPTGSRMDIRDAPVAQNGRPYPLVIYSHGFMSTRLGGTFLTRHLASYGYIVAAPDFPLTNSSAPGGANVLDLANQPGDVSFLIDQLLALSADVDSRFAGAVDRQRIGLTGLSLGGSTTFLTAFHPTLRDPRVRAAAPIAGGACFFGKDFYADTSVPLLILHGDIDAIVPYVENAVFAFAEANPPKYLVTILGGSHTGFADGIELLVENQNNPDDLGCRALGGNSAADSGASFLERLGGPAVGIIMGECPLPCAGPRPLPRSIRPTRQHDLTLLSIFPFFEATLRDNRSARRFLEETLAAENPDVTIAF